MAVEEQINKEEIADEKKQIDKIIVGKSRIRLTYIETSKPIDFNNITIIWE